MADTDREAFEAWLGIKPVGAAHYLAWAAWKAATQRQQERIAQLEAEVGSQAESIRTHEALLSNLMKLLPGCYYMDPPDGGSVTLLEQFERMAVDAECFRFWVREAACAPGDMARLIATCITEQEYRDAIMPVAAASRTVIDAAIAASKGEAGNADV